MSADGSADTWSDTGYVTEIPYTRDYLRYQSPVKMAFAAASNGFAFPNYKAGFRYCDLGCGEAVTTICLAAAYPDGEFVGVDFNPEHIRNATSLAQAAGLTNVTFLEAGFDDPRIREIGPFDFIGAHGVYSWVSPDVQRQMHDLLNDVLAPGGLYYFCHYVRPGGQRTEALFHLVQSLMATKTGPISSRVSEAVKDLRHLIDNGAPFFDRMGSMESTVRDLESRDERYLIHEFGNKYFNPRYVSEISHDLAAIGLHHVGSTRFDRNETENLFASGQPAGLSDLPHDEREIRASLLSFDQFRWDVYRKSHPDDDAGAPQDPSRMDGFCVDASIFPYAFPKSDTLWEREVSLTTPEFNCVAVLCREGRSTIGDIISATSSSGMSADDVRQIIRDMMSTWMFQPIVETPHPLQLPTSKAYRFKNSLSRVICQRDLLAEGRISLASRVTGGALKLNRFESLAADAMQDRTPAEAKSELQKQMRAFDPALRERFKVHRYESDEDFDSAWSEFFRTTLPRLVKYDVMAPVV